MSRCNAENEDITSTLVSTNRSCEFCHRRKRRCDGDGLSCCSFCMEKGQQCVYPKRRQYKARRSRVSRSTTSSGPGGAASSANNAISVGKVWGSGSTDFGTLTSLARSNGNISSTKRVKLSPSLACGLVGMLENKFLSDYFRCWGLVPWTSPRTIRRAMVTIMLGSMPQHQSWSSSGSDGNSSRETTDSARVSSAASMCMFWSAIVMGAIAQGRPVTTLEGYIQRAVDSLMLCANGETEEVARAYSMMAKVQQCAGRKMFYSEYSRRAAVIVQAIGLDAVPDLLKFIACQPVALKFGHVSTFEPEELKAFGNETYSPCQMSRIASKDDVCRYLLESEGGLSRAIAADVGSDGAHDTDDRDYSIRQQPKTNIDGPSGRHSPAESLMESMNDARPMSAMLRYLLESAPQFRRVQEIVDSSEFGNGVAGLMVNRLMAIAKAANNDGNGAIESIKRCVEIVSCYPGICGVLGIHTVHCALTALASVEDHETYETLRTAYDQVRPEGEIPLPPMEERLMADNFCDALLCREMQRVVESGNFGLSPSAFRHHRIKFAVSECRQHDEGETASCLSREVLDSVLGELDDLKTSQQQPRVLQQCEGEVSDGAVVPLNTSTVVAGEAFAVVAESSDDVAAGLTPRSAAFSTQLLRTSACRAELDISSSVGSEGACQESSTSGDPAAETSGAPELYSWMESNTIEDEATLEDWLDAASAILVETESEARMR